MVKMNGKGSRSRVLNLKGYREKMAKYLKRRNLMEYTLVVKKTPSELKERVNEMIRDGWEPLGGISVTQMDIGSNLGSVMEKLFAQAVIKRKFDKEFDEDLANYILGKILEVIELIRESLE